jgi:hypothetical protein
MTRPVIVLQSGASQDIAQFGRRLGGLAVRLLPWALLFTLLFGLSSCDDATGPTNPPYIAIVAIISAPEGTQVGTTYSYRVSEISGTLHFDKTYRVAPSDTVIVPVKAATYSVSLTGIPPQCLVQDGGDRLLYVPDGTNTAMVRYQISCQSQFSAITATDGYQPDQAYIYRITGTGILGANDTLRVDGLAPGDYEADLSHVASNCVVTNDGGRHIRFTVADTVRTSADFRIVCSDETKRPHIDFFASSYHDGASGFMFRVSDPDGDVERYFWDITDCQGKSVLPEGGRVRRGLSTDRVRGEDTATVFGAIELGHPDADMQGRCTSIRVEDEYGNSTTVAEEPIGNESGPGPSPASFNAIFTNISSLTAHLVVNDPSFAGSFAAARMRDGALSGTPDGQPDIGVYNTAGFTDVLLPTVPLGSGRPPYYDYYAVILYLFDNQGNFSRIEDDDLFN